MFCTIHTSLDLKVKVTYFGCFMLKFHLEFISFLNYPSWSMKPFDMGLGSFLGCSSSHYLDAVADKRSRLHTKTFTSIVVVADVVLRPR